MEVDRHLPGQASEGARLCLNLPWDSRIQITPHSVSLSLDTSVSKVSLTFEIFWPNFWNEILIYFVCAGCSHSSSFNHP